MSLLEVRGVERERERESGERESGERESGERERERRLTKGKESLRSNW